MLPIKKIVSPTDFSEPSNKGLDAAVELARQFDAELVIIHVIAPLPVMGEASSLAGYHAPTVMDQLNKETQELLKKLIRDRVPEKIRTRSHIARGRAADEIVRLAQEESADLIVIASHGASGFDRFLFGSVAERVVRKAEGPVLTIRVAEESD